MKLLGFNFTKINVEKKKDSIKDLKIHNHIDVLSIEEVKQEFFKTEDNVLIIKFSYSIEYEPQIAHLSLEGTILLSVEKEEMVKEILKKWKEKGLLEEFRIPLFNVIFRKAGLKALELEDEMNLPLHMSMPIMKKQADSGKK
jgi:hypothetical protein